MRNSMLFLLILLLSAAVVAADFSGTWALNSGKSQLGEGFGGRMAAKKLVVEQKENALKIDRTVEGRDGGERVVTEQMTLDGKETKAATQFGDAIYVAGVAENVLTINTTRIFERDGQTSEMKSEQKWALEEGGKVLVINSKSSGPWGDSEMKLVYDKQ